MNGQDRVSMTTGDIYIYVLIYIYIYAAFAKTENLQSLLFIQYLLLCNGHEIIYFISPLVFHVFKATVESLSTQPDLAGNYCLNKSSRPVFDKYRNYQRAERLGGGVYRPVDQGGVCVFSDSGFNPFVNKSLCHWLCLYISDCDWPCWCDGQPMKPQFM